MTFFVVFDIMSIFQLEKTKPTEVKYLSNDATHTMYRDHKILTSYMHACSVTLSTFRYICIN